MNKALSDEQLVALEQRVFSLNAFDDAELRQVFADLRSAQAAALQPGQVGVRETDLRKLVDGFVLAGACINECPAATVQCTYLSSVCRAALLAHIGLAAKPTEEVSHEQY